MTPKVVYPEYDDSVEEDEIFQSEDSQVFVFKTLMNMKMVKMIMMMVVVVRNVLLMRVCSETSLDTWCSFGSLCHVI